MASLVKLFKKKPPKSDIPATQLSSDTLPTRGKQGTTASFRTSLYRRQSPPESRSNVQDEEESTNLAGKYKSPYHLVTEPRTKRATRSCPGGSVPPLHQNNVFRKFSPPTTIHELSGSYENFSAAQLQQIKEAHEQEEQERMKLIPTGGQTNGRFKMGDIKKERQAQRSANNNNHIRRRVPPQHQSTTSEYGSADPSPISEQQQQHFPFSPKRQQVLVGSYVHSIEKEESTSEDGEDTSDEEEISPACLIQFWQQQTRMLKRELKGCRETAEKYRGKYLRLKSRVDELSVELAKEKERTTWLFNQLMFNNEKMVQMSLSYFQQQQQQRNNAGDAVPNGPSSANALHQQQRLARLFAGYKPPVNGGDKNGFGAHCSAAGEIQAELSSDSDELLVQLCGKQQRTPTPVPAEEAENSVHHHHHHHHQQQPFGNGGTPFLNFNNSLFDPQRQPLDFEVPRSGNIGARSSQSRLISPPFARNGIYMDQPSIVEEDEEQTPVIIPLDDFCHPGPKANGASSPPNLLRQSYSSDDLRINGTGKANMLGVLSSSEDDIRMWKKQLKSRGDRVLFRPSRKSLFMGAFEGDEKAAQKLFRRFGRPEREALAKFDYLRDERTDVSGLMSSPEKPQIGGSGK